MQISNNIAKGIVKAVLIIAGLAVLAWLFYQIRALFVYIIVAAIITLICRPFVRFLKNRLKFPNLAAAITTLTLLIILIISLIRMFVPLITSQGENLSLLNTNAIQHKATILLNQLERFFSENNIAYNDFLKNADLQDKINFNWIPSFLNAIIETVGSFGIGLASVFFITFFFLKDKNSFISGVKNVLPERYSTRILNSFRKTNELLTRYFAGLLLQLTIIFVLNYIVLLIFGVKDAFVIAFLCAILNIIPYVGPMIGIILAAMLTMISNLGLDFETHTLPITIYVVIGFLVVQLIDNYLSQPLIFSNSVKSHPLEIFIVILAAGMLYGITGMIIAVPFYTILKVFAKEFFPENKFIKIITHKL